MTRSELISKLAHENPNLTVKDIEKVVHIVFDEMVNALSAGHRVEFRGFGTFSVRSRAAHMAKNPKTGKAVSVDARRTIHFKMGKELQGLLNPQK